MDHSLHAGFQSKVYDSRWKRWFFWCRDYAGDREHPTQPILADFVLMLWGENKALEMLKGYRSAINLALGASG